MQRPFWTSLLAVLCGSLFAQSKDIHHWTASRTALEGRPASIQLAPRVTTTIRLPEPVNSVVLGDSSLFQAEYSPKEPLLVFARPTGSGIAHTNLVISTVFGRQFILLLRSLGSSVDETESAVDLLVTCRVAQVRFIDESFPAALISETVRLAAAAAKPNDPGSTPETSNGLQLDAILNRQRSERIERLYGDGIRVGIGEVAEDGHRLIVPFSVISSKSETAELLPPQVQLGGQTKTGIFRQARWTTVEQLPVEAYQMSQRRLPPGGRIDGVVVFERPPFKQSRETLLLQIADTTAVDQPTLAPITFTQTKPLEDDHE